MCVTRMGIWWRWEGMRMSNKCLRFSMRIVQDAQVEPVVDGDVLHARPIDSIVAGAGAGVDVLIGTNFEEQRLMVVPNGYINSINEDMLAGTIAAYGLPVSETIDTYRSIRPNASAGELFAAIVTDWFYR